MDMAIIWILLGAWFIWENTEVLNSLSVWRLVAAIVILTIGAPVFLLSDLLELLLDIVVGEEDGE